MAPLDDHSQQRRPLFFPVVIATVLLTIIGMIGGYLLGEERNRKSATPSSSSAPALDLVDGPPCPEQTQKAGAIQGASGELIQVLRVRTARKTVVWICQDRAGALYYHANKGGTDAEWVENKTALFLAGVWRDSNGAYVATAVDGAVFAVDRERLRITHADGREETQKVVGE
ncbi:hypothetical protein [Actinoplanes missouriensis]|uniref:hypothetical protein n=1 Tax=Actinoplanes missouriensis TaxID=1866 RepID=UPI001E5A70FB|nr:hypothetical protein [Actinoplanes missouriensis]